jgi:hypothetical protein
VVWIVRLVTLGADGETRCTDVMEISRSDGISDIANLGLTLAEAEQLLTGAQREIVTAQAEDHDARRRACPHCGGDYRVKDYRQHAVATLVGQVTMLLPRLRCAMCGRTEAGIALPLDAGVGSASGVSFRAPNLPNSR